MYQTCFDPCALCRNLPFMPSTLECSPTLNKTTTSRAVKEPSYSRNFKHYFASFHHTHFASFKATKLPVQVLVPSL